jgi:hypothetical protein
MGTMELAPEGTSPLVVFGAMAALAGLDLLGAVLAKGWAEGGSLLRFAAGLATFALLFVVYARILTVAELSTVTFGWIVCLQVGLLLFERIRYAVQIPTGKMVAIVVILALQAYLVLGPSGQPSPRTQPGATVRDQHAIGSIHGASAPR